MSQGPASEKLIVKYDSVQDCITVDTVDGRMVGRVKPMVKIVTYSSSSCDDFGLLVNQIKVRLNYSSLCYSGDPDMDVFFCVTCTAMLMAGIMVEAKSR